MIYTENNLINSDGNIYLIVNSLIKINHIITGSNKFTLGKVRLNPYEFEKMYVDKDLMEDKLYQ